MTVHDAVAVAAAHHRDGRLDDAEAIYHQILAAYPDVPEVLNLLGVLHYQRGRHGEAAALIRRAIAGQPGAAEYHLHLGVALSATGDFAQAIEAGRRAVILSPHLPEAHYNLGLWLAESGCPDDALKATREALRLHPTYSEAHCSAGNILASQDRFEEAISAYAEAVRHRPDYAEAHYNLANMLVKRGQEIPALQAYRTAVTLRPDYADAHFNLGITLQRLGELDAAAAAYEAALRTQPHHAGAHWHLGNVWKERGRISEAIASWRCALAITPADAALRSTLLLYLRYDPATTPDLLAREEAIWNERHAVPLRRQRPPHRLQHDPGKTLRIGYVSPDFWDHAVGRNVLPLISAHDREKSEIFCYSGAVRADALTERFRTLADHWCDTTRMTDEELAAQIRADGVDILVDLALHTGGNRLPVFARQPAPVQFSFAGYPGGTGVETIEHRLSDPHLEGASEGSRTTHLIDSFWCFDPIELKIPVNPLPAMTRPELTFGCLNQPCKINDSVLTLWARVLRECVNTRLLLLSPHGSHRAGVLETLRDLGVAGERVDFVPPDTRLNYMRHYHRVDVMLDTFPYNGHTTSLEALWMGVPMVTLPGESPVSRAGLSQLRQLDLPEFVARDADDYVRIAAELAADLPRLAAIRQTLRPRMEQSALMDATRFARAIERAYRAAWMDWCGRTGG